MTKFNSVTRKIKKRKRKEDNTTSAPSESSTAPEPSAPPKSTTPASEPIKRIKISQTEKNRKKKAAKYKLKKRQHKVNNTRNTKTIRKSKSPFLTTTRRWIWKTQKSINFTLKQKKSLFKTHNISKIIEKNNSTLYNLKSTLSNASFKDNSGNISFSQQSSTQLTPAATLEEIDYLENENKKLKNIILNIKSTEKYEYQHRIRQLKRITSNHGYYLRKRITNLNKSLSNFLTHLQSRINLWE